MTTPATSMTDSDPAQAGVAVCGHFGELLQGRLGPDGPVALISLPCPDIRLEAWLSPQPPGGDLAARLLPPSRRDRLLNALALQPPPGHLHLRAGAPVGAGTGTSTAALVALARLAGYRGPPRALAEACVTIEGASDPLMFPRPERLLFASRSGRVLRELPPLPEFEVLGGFLGPGLATDPQDTDFPDIADLVDPWAEAAARGDLPALAGLAAVSSRRCLDLRGPAGDPTGALARDLGAPGWLIAHTGSARGLIFAPGRVPAQAAERLRAAGFEGVLRFRAGGAG